MIRERSGILQLGENPRILKDLGFADDIVRMKQFPVLKQGVGLSAATPRVASLSRTLSLRLMVQ